MPPLFRAGACAGALALLALALALAQLPASAAAARVSTGSKKWDHMDWKKAEKDLEEGDDAELLATEDSLHMKELERRKSQGMRPPGPEVGLKDPTEWVKHSQAMAGPAMLFCTLTENDPRSGKPWGNESLQRMAFEWRELLKTGGLEASVYDISDEASKKMLVTMQAGWNAYGLRDFLLKQPELLELEWDNVKYHPEDVGMLEENRGKPVVDPLASLRNEGAFGGIVQAPKAPSPTPTPAPKKNAKMAKAAAPSPAPAPEATAKPEL